MIHQLKTLTASAVVLASLVACAASPASQVTLRVVDDLPAPPPINSHTGPFDEELRNGRVNIQSLRSVLSESGVGISVSSSFANIAIAELYLADGQLLSCVAHDLKGKSHAWEGTWDPAYVRNRSPYTQELYYDPSTGLQIFWDYDKIKGEIHGDLP